MVHRTTCENMTTIRTDNLEKFTSEKERYRSKLEKLRILCNNYIILQYYKKETKVDKFRKEPMKIGIEDDDRDGCRQACVAVMGLNGV